MNWNKKRYAVDLLIIMLIGAGAYAVYGIFYMLLKMDTGKFPVLVQTLIGAMCEFGVMGLGVVIICIRRKESFLSFGLRKEKLLLSVFLAAAACLPSFLYLFMTSEEITYFPLQNVNFTKPVLAAGFPVNVAGMLLIILVWGFFEGFSYVVMADRINRLLPPKNLLLDWGAIFCGIFCLVLHILVGQSYSIMSAVTEFLVIYGMLVGCRYTGNAWGCVMLFCFYWSALGGR